MGPRSRFICVRLQSSARPGSPRLIVVVPEGETFPLMRFAALRRYRLPIERGKDNLEAAASTKRYAPRLYAGAGNCRWCLLEVHKWNAVAGTGAEKTHQRTEGWTLERELTALRALRGPDGFMSTM
jgi:hypothetical protein